MSSVGFDTANYTLPDDIRVNNTVYVFEENAAPRLLDDVDAPYTVDGHDYRSDFDWILRQGYNWVITDTADVWASELSKQGKRNVEYFMSDAVGGSKNGWYRKHTKDFG